MLSSRPNFHVGEAGLSRFISVDDDSTNSPLWHWLGLVSYVVARSADDNRTSLEHTQGACPSACGIGHGCRTLGVDGDISGEMLLPMTRQLPRSLA